MRVVAIVTMTLVVISLYFSPQLKKVVKPHIVYNIKDECVNSTTESGETANLNR
jgi:hypothetical protein